MLLLYRPNPRIPARYSLEGRYLCNNTLLVLLSANVISYDISL